MSAIDRPHFPPLQGARQAWGTIALSLAVFMIILDSSIANVSIPAISGDVGVSPTQGTWIVTSFAVANAIAIPLTGWLTLRIGQVRLFVGAVLLFAVSSWLCGLAPNIETLIAARVLQGAVAGPIVPLSHALLLPSYRPDKTGMALAFWGTTTLVAPILGPVLGGWISDNYTWPWIFYINIPIGLFTASVTWSIYRKRESHVRQVRMDKIGLVLLIAWVGALQILLDRGQELDWFNSSICIVLLAVAVLGFIYFVVWELYDPHPVINLALFKNKNFSSGVVALSVTYGLFFASLVILPVWLQTQISYTATEAGKVMAPVGILAILMTPLVGMLLQKIDARWLATCGLLIFSLVFQLRARFTPEIDGFSLMIPTLIQGAAMAMFFTPVNSIILSGLSPEKIATAASLFIFARTIFGGLATSIVSTLWESRTIFHHARLVENLSASHLPFNQSAQVLIAQGMSGISARLEIDQLVTVQASTMGATDIFTMSSILFVVSIGLVWLTKPVKLVNKVEK